MFHQEILLCHENGWKEKKTPWRKNKYGCRVLREKKVKGEKNIKRKCLENGKEEKNSRVYVFTMAKMNYFYV